MLPLVTNMGDPKNPWDDVPIEVLIEEERKKREQEELARPRIHLPVPERSPPPRSPDEEESEEDSDFKVVIKLV
jgi:hypothetical protein